MQTKEFASDPLVLICPPTHNLAQHQELNLVEALSYGFIGLKPHHSLQQSIETQAKLLGFNIQYRLRLPNFGAIAEVVAKGVGIAIMPARAAQRLQSNYNFHSIQLQARGQIANYFWRPKISTSCLAVTNSLQIFIAASS